MVNGGNPTGRPMWQSLVRPHRGLFYLSISNTPDRTIARVMTRNWSHRVGLAAGNGNAFLVYKRSVQFGSVARKRLFLEQFRWQGADVRLVPVFTDTDGDPEPIEIPLQALGYRQESGYYLWAGFSSARNRLIVLTQAVPTAPASNLQHLVLLSGDPGADLRDPASWEATTLDIGGYDLDARIDDDTQLSYIYRRAPYPMKLPLQLPPPLLPPGLTYDTETTQFVDPDVENFYNPLFMRQRDLVSGATALAYDDIPGGEHPKIQNLEPLYITADRLEAMVVVARRWRVFPFGTSPGNLILLPRHVRYQKRLLMRRPDGWRSGVLHEIGEGWLPRDFTYLRPNNRPPLVYVSDAAFLEGERWGFGLLPNLLPMYLVGFSEEPVEDTKRFRVDFMFHHSGREALTVSRYLIDPIGGSLDPQEVGVSVYDLNHGQIADPSELTPSGLAENQQFWPFTQEFSEDLVNSLALVLAHPNFTDIDNTIGGALRVDQNPLGVSFYAYNDLGETGGRVIFAENFPPPDPQPDTSKLFDLGQIVTSGAGVEEWVEITPPLKLPTYQSYFGLLGSLPSSINSMLEPMLDMLITETGGNVAPGEEHTIRRGDIEDFQDLLHSLIPFSDPVTSPSSPTPVASFRYKPEFAFAQTAVEFNASASDSTANPVSNVTWDFGDDTPTASGLVVHHIYDLDGAVNAETFEVKATVSYSGGANRTLTTEITVQPFLWDQLWEISDQLRERAQGEQDATVNTLRLNALKYDIRFLMDDGERDRVEFTLQDGHDFNVEFSGGENQGTILQEHQLRLRSQDIDLGGALGNLFSFDEFDVRFTYGRRYTPGILVSDQRFIHPLLQTIGAVDTTELVRSDETGPTVTALSAKPFGDTVLIPGRIEVDFSTTFTGFLVELVASAILAIGLVYLAGYLLGLWASFLAAVSSPYGWLVALILALIITIVLFFVIPAAIEGKVRREIRESLAAPETREMLDRSGLARYSGEGLAESMALKVIDQTDGLELDAEGFRSGRNRFRNQTWQWIVVTSGKARILIRK